MKKKCPTCRETIESDKANYSVLELLDSRLVVDTNGELKDKILSHLKTIELVRQKLRHYWSMKSQTLSTTVESVKDEIYQKTQSLIDQLMDQQEKLISEADFFKEGALAKLNDYSDYSDFNVAIAGLPPKDLESMSKSELEAYMILVMNRTVEIKQREKDLDAIEPRIELEASRDSLIGSLSTNITTAFKTDRISELELQDSWTSRLHMRQNPYRIRQVYFILSLLLFYFYKLSLVNQNE